MISLFIIVIVIAFIFLYKPKERNNKPNIPDSFAAKLDKLWDIAQQSIKEQKYLRAEKALLTILKFNERDAGAYNRLGILYAKQKAFKDAIECFEISQSLEPNPSSLHNVGLINYEIGDYPKAAIAFEQAIQLEDDLPARYVAYAKVLEKLGESKKMLEAIEKAVELEPTPQLLRVLADAYSRNGQEELARELDEKARKMITPGLQHPQSIKQPRRVI